jgi:hypothetical protein
MLLVECVKQIDVYDSLTSHVILCVPRGSSL